MANSPVYPHRRKILIVDKDFQRKFILKFWSLVAGGAVLSGFIIYMMCGNAVTTVFHNSRLRIMSTADFILPSFLLSACVVTAVVGTATAFIALYMSHRIAGPAFRLQKDIEAFAGGYFKQVFRLRDKDEFQPVAAALNIAAKNIRDGVVVLKEELEYLEKISKDLPPKAKEHVKNMQKVLGQYHV